MNHQTVNIWYVPRKKDIFGKSDNALQAAERYIEENGPEAFENLISKANKYFHCNNFYFFNYDWDFSSLQAEKAPKARKGKTKSILEEVAAEQEAKALNSNSYSIFDDLYRY